MGTSELICTLIEIEEPLLYLGVFNIIGALLSWKRNKDWAWTTIAFLLGPLYVIYWLITEYL